MRCTCSHLLTPAAGCDHFTNNWDDLRPQDRGENECEKSRVNREKKEAASGKRKRKEKKQKKAPNKEVVAFTGSSRLGWRSRAAPGSGGVHGQLPSEFTAKHFVDADILRCNSQPPLWLAYDAR